MAGNSAAEKDDGDEGEDDCSPAMKEEEAAAKESESESLASVAETPTLASVQKAATRAVKSGVGEVFFLRFTGAASSEGGAGQGIVDNVADAEAVVRVAAESKFLVEGSVYFEKKSSRLKFLEEKEFSAEECGLKVVVLTKEAAAIKRKGKFPGSYPS